MGFFKDSFDFQRWYRNRAIGGAILMVPVLAYLFLAAYRYNNREVIEEKQVQAKVTHLEFKGKDSYRHFKTTLELPSGETIELRIAPSPYAPHVGESLPVQVIKHKSGVVDYKLNRKAWKPKREH